MDALAAEMVAFSNSEGGHILIGVTDAGELEGIPLAETLRACVPSTEPFRAKETAGTYFAKGQREAKPGDRRVGVI